MNTICPRCESDQTSLLHTGLENNKPLWRVFHCHHCAFTWRDSEPEESINPAKRPDWAQLKGVDLENLRQGIPPSGKPDPALLSNTKK